MRSFLLLEYLNFVEFLTLHHLIAFSCLYGSQIEEMANMIKKVSIEGWECTPALKTEYHSQDFFSAYLYSFFFLSRRANIWSRSQVLESLLHVVYRISEVPRESGLFRLLFGSS